MGNILLFLNQTSFVQCVKCLFPLSPRKTTVKWWRVHACSVKYPHLGKLLMNLKNKGVPVCTAFVFTEEQDFWQEEEIRGRWEGVTFQPLIKEVFWGKSQRQERKGENVSGKKTRRSAGGGQQQGGSSKWNSSETMTLNHKRNHGRKKMESSWNDRRGKCKDKHQSGVGGKKCPPTFLFCLLRKIALNCIEFVKRTWSSGRRNSKTRVRKTQWRKARLNVLLAECFSFWSTWTNKKNWAAQATYSCDSDQTLKPADSEPNWRKH